ncbi:hypothetical protein PR003_g26424 [Phytophthora rubi]|uniref:Uncharacterized protein n=1 Tax=Phytophthora rubi TaxID=129364 RepID=A0A6A3I6X5_9STRA|nr:hypothetical protein PR002_g24854 [Phytophthora rubi]KAE8980111.1 hypothetical protein PR001_g24365 [Phytophthora rubi]KAE9286042.1 hypothetical protein PR003_g26424 [Phytophthora rubi]
MCEHFVQVATIHRCVAPAWPALAGRNHGAAVSARSSSTAAPSRRQLQQQQQRLHRHRHLCSFNSSQLLGDTGEELEEEEDYDDGEDVSAGEDGEGMDAGGEDVEEVDDGRGGATAKRAKTLWRRRCGRRECRRHG